MQHAFEVVAAKSKREDPDAPGQVPMRPQTQIRQSLSADQKKIRRQMSRKTAVDYSRTDEYVCEWCPGDYATRFGTDSRDELMQHLVEQHDYDMTTHEIRSKTSSGSGDYDSDSNWSGSGDAEHNLGSDACPAEHGGTCDLPGHQQHGSDDDEGETREGSLHTTKEITMTARREAQILQAMATASLADQRALATELAGLRNSRAASLQAARDVDLADTVVRAHLTPVATHTLHTAATDWVGEDLAVYSGDPTLAVKAEAVLWFNKTSAAVKEDREEFAAQAVGMANRTAGRFGEAFEVAHRAFLDHVAHLHRKSAGSEAGPGDPSQGQSTITDYDTQADQDPLFAEDWPDAEGEGVHPTPVNLAENTSTGGGTAGDPVEKGAARTAAPREKFNLSDAKNEDGEWVMSPEEIRAEQRADDEPEDEDDFYERESSKRTAAEGSTCSSCGAAIEQDPAGEEPRTWHHNDGSKHDHEAKPGSKESRRVTAKAYECFFQGERFEVEADNTYAAEKKAQEHFGTTERVNVNEVQQSKPKESSRKKALKIGDSVEMAEIPNCDVCRVNDGKTTPAAYDAKLVGLGGSWGYVCEPHFQQYGPGQTGTGYAQKLTRRAAKQAGSEVGPKDAPVGISGLPDVTVTDQDHPEGLFPWQMGETKGFVSGASRKVAERVKAVCDECDADLGYQDSQGDADDTVRIHKNNQHFKDSDKTAAFRARIAANLRNL